MSGAAARALPAFDLAGFDLAAFVEATLAEDLGGDYGITLVIDHGAGVRTIFYGLSDIDIKAGQQVKQGQTLATCGKTTVVEMRIGTVPIDPIAVCGG